MIQDLKLKNNFNSFAKNEEWFSINIKKIVSKHTDEFIAVLKPGIMETDSNLDTLLEKVAKSGKSDSAFITAIPKKGMAAIL